MTPEEERRAHVREALMRLREDDASARERERIGALTGILALIFGVVCIGAIPVAEAILFPFLFVVFCFSGAVGLTVKRWLDARVMRQSKGLSRPAD